LTVGVLARPRACAARGFFVAELLLRLRERHCNPVLATRPLDANRSIR
jgi:hypothetical protein